ncbi:MAG: thiamine pyrophosphate-binding protein [Armatimonadota bacterium]|nr:thiamine pyrophosphate-binding protein [Armatimonadota bacterium]
MGYREMLAGLREAGVGLLVSVPDTWMSGLLAAADAVPWIRHIRAAREEEAVGICAGYAFAGARPALIVQNGGLLGCGSELVLLTKGYRLPMLLLVSHRGSAGDPYWLHVPKAVHVVPFLSALAVPHYTVAELGGLPRAVVRAMEYAEAAETGVALLLGKDDLA